MVQHYPSLQSSRETLPSIDVRCHDASHDRKRAMHGRSSMRVTSKFTLPDVDAAVKQVTQAPLPPSARRHADGGHYDGLSPMSGDEWTSAGRAGRDGLSSSRSSSRAALVAEMSPTLHGPPPRRRTTSNASRFNDDQQPVSFAALSARDSKVVVDRLHSSLTPHAMEGLGGWSSRHASSVSALPRSNSRMAASPLTRTESHDEPKKGRRVSASKAGPSVGMTATDVMDAAVFDAPEGGDGELVEGEKGPGVLNSSRISLASHSVFFSHVLFVRTPQGIYARHSRPMRDLRLPRLLRRWPERSPHGRPKSNMSRSRPSTRASVRDDGKIEWSGGEEGSVADYDEESVAGGRASALRSLYSEFCGINDGMASDDVVDGMFRSVQTGRLQSRPTSGQPELMSKTYQNPNPFRCGLFLNPPDDYDTGGVALLGGRKGHELADTVDDEMRTFIQKGVDALIAEVQEQSANISHSDVESPLSSRCTSTMRASRPESRPASRGGSRLSGRQTPMSSLFSIRRMVEVRDRALFLTGRDVDADLEEAFVDERRARVARIFKIGAATDYFGVSSELDAPLTVEDVAEHGRLFPPMAQFKKNRLRPSLNISAPRVVSIGTMPLPARELVRYPLSQVRPRIFDAIPWQYQAGGSQRLSLKCGRHMRLGLPMVRVGMIPTVQVHLEWIASLSVGESMWVRESTREAIAQAYVKKYGALQDSAKFEGRKAIVQLKHMLRIGKRLNFGISTEKVVVKKAKEVQGYLSPTVASISRALQNEESRGEGSGASGAEGEGLDGIMLRMGVHTRASFRRAAQILVDTGVVQSADTDEDAIFDAQRVAADLNYGRLPNIQFGEGGGLGHGMKPLQRRQSLAHVNSSVPWRRRPSGIGRRDVLQMNRGDGEGEKNFRI